MNSAKARLLAWVQSLPDDSEWEDLTDDLEFRAAVARGLADVRDGRVVSQEEAERESAGWLARWPRRT
jgi:predicted transcriptional regulator